MRDSSIAHNTDHRRRGSAPRRVRASTRARRLSRTRDDMVRANDATRRRERWRRWRRRERRRARGATANARRRRRDDGTPRLGSRARRTRGRSRGRTASRSGARARRAGGWMKSTRSIARRDAAVARSIAGDGRTDAGGRGIGKALGANAAGGREWTRRRGRRIARTVD